MITSNNPVIESVDFEVLQGMARVLSNVLYNYPDEAQLDKFSAGELGDRWPVNSSMSERLQQVLNLWQQASPDERSELILGLKVDYGQLFFGPASPKSAPWGSVYTSATGLLNERSTLELMDFLRSNGIDVKTAYTQPVDHIGLIFAVIDQLLQELVADPQNPRARALLHTLLQQHLLPWSGRCLGLAQQHAETDYYRCFAKLADDFLKQLSDLFGIVPVAVRQHS